VHSHSKEKTDHAKDRFYKEKKAGFFFYHFPKCPMKLLLGNFNEKLGRKGIFKSRIGNESIHQDTNDNGVSTVNFATSKNVVVQITKTFINTPGPLLMGRLTTRLITY
jgi:hypothetical protein